MAQVKPIIAVVGRPNVGKSTFFNKMVGARVSIVEDTPGVTRDRVYADSSWQNYEFTLVDTGGIDPYSDDPLLQQMRRQAEIAVDTADVILFFVDGKDGLTGPDYEVADLLRRTKKPVLLVVNKIDTLANKEKLMPRILAFTKEYEFSAVVPISALTRDGVDAVLGELEAFAAPSPFFFDADTLTDQPERVIVAEIVREKLLRNLRDEIPHGTAVSVESMKEREGQDLVDIEAQIYCERESHKGMIIGKGGEMLKRIATQARQDIERFLGCRVNLKCWVKVREDWRNRENVIRSLGYN